MKRMMTKSSTNEPNTEPRTAPTITPACFEPDDEVPFIGVGDEDVDDGKTEDETEEGDKEGGVEKVVGGRVEVVAGDGDGGVVEGSADTEVGVAEVKEFMLDSEPGDPIPVGLDGDGSGEDKPP
jgi:hypothetical protein